MNYDLEKKNVLIENKIEEDYRLEDQAIRLAERATPHYPENACVIGAPYLEFSYHNTIDRKKYARFYLADLLGNSPEKFSSNLAKETAKWKALVEGRARSNSHWHYIEKIVNIPSVCVNTDGFPIDWNNFIDGELTFKYLSMRRDGAPPRMLIAAIRLGIDLESAKDRFYGHFETRLDFLSNLLSSDAPRTVVDLQELEREIMGDFICHDHHYFLREPLYPDD